MQLVATRTDDESAQHLLDAYFSSRELGFVTHADGYQRTNPDPAAFIEPAGIFYVVQDDDGTPMGCGGVRRVADYCDQTCFEIKHLWISPSKRGRGLSRTLMTALEAFATSQGARWCVLDTNESLVAAQQLYRSGGYEQIEPYNDNPNATHWFAKRLLP